MAGVPAVVQWLKNPTATAPVTEGTGSIPTLAQWVKRIWCCHSYVTGLSWGLDSILAQELPYSVGAAIKKI